MANSGRWISNFTGVASVFGWDFFSPRCFSLFLLGSVEHGICHWWWPLVLFSVLQSMHLACCLCVWYFERPQSRIGVITLVVSGALQKWVDVRMVHFHKMCAAWRYQSWQLVTTTHDKDNGLILHEWHSSGYETQDADFGIIVCLKSWVDYYNLICSHLMKSATSHGWWFDRSWMTDKSMSMLILLRLVLVLTGTDRTVSFKVLIVEFFSAISWICRQ